MKESVYNLCAQDSNGNYYLLNTRRGTAHVLAASAYAAYWTAASRPSDLEGATEALHELINKGFLVDDDADELSEIESAHQQARQSRERLELLIAPSMACNLDCFYCFESNRYAGQMSADVQSNIVRLARGYFESGTKHLDVTWYGGEPLLAMSVVGWLSRQFLATCDEFDREYSAGIVTNGSLMTGEKARQLASWSIRRAQITLDGPPELHDARRVPKNKNPTFYRIVDGIEAAAAHMRVSVRVNVCRKVAERLEELLQILAARGLNREVSVYVAPLQNVQSRRTLSPSTARIREQLDVLDSREVADLELRFNDLLWKYGFATSNRLPEPRCTTCMADRQHSWLIEANGDVQKCYWTAGLGAEAAGRLTQDGIAPLNPHRKWRNWTASRDTRCLQCIMFPICLGRCPLKHLSNESDCCPPIKYNWIQCLAHAAGIGDEQLVPACLQLAGEQVRRLKVRDVTGADQD